MKTQYINSLHPAAQSVKEAALEGLAVVNGSRPVGGDNSYTGEYIRGVHYATGAIERWEKHWEEMDMWRLEVVTNAQVLQAVIREGSQRTCTSQLAEKLVRKGSRLLVELARNWVDLEYCLVSEDDYHDDLNRANWRDTPERFEAEKEFLAAHISPLLAGSQIEEILAEHFIFSVDDESPIWQENTIEYRASLVLSVDLPTGRFVLFLVETDGNLIPLNLIEPTATAAGPALLAALKSALELPQGDRI